MKSTLTHLWAALLLAAVVPVLTITSAHAQTATNGWDRSAALGLTLTKGNSDTVLFTGNVLATEKHDSHEIILGGDAAYGEDRHVKNNETLHVFGQFNHLFTPRLYVYGRVDGLHDGVAGIKYRLTVSPGAGYYWIKDEKTSLSTEVGPGMIYEKRSGHDSSNQATYTTSTYFTVRLAEKFERKLNDHAKVWQSCEILPQVDDLSHYIMNAEVGVETGLTKALSLRVYADDSYDSKPPAGRKRNDLKLVSAVAWKF